MFITTICDHNAYYMYLLSYHYAGEVAVLVCMSSEYEAGQEIQISPLWLMIHLFIAY